MRFEAGRCALFVAEQLARIAADRLVFDVTDEAVGDLALGVDAGVVVLHVQQHGRLGAVEVFERLDDGQHGDAALDEDLTTPRERLRRSAGGRQVAEAERVGKPLLNPFEVGRARSRAVREP